MDRIFKNPLEKLFLPDPRSLESIMRYWQEVKYYMKNRRVECEAAKEADKEPERTTSQKKHGS